MALSLPNGYGVGIGMWSLMRQRMYLNDEKGYVEHVLHALDPDWSYNWGGELFSDSRRMFCSIQPPDQYPAQVLEGLSAKGIDPNMRTWLLLCEPNGSQYGSLSVKEAMTFVNEVYRTFQSRYDDGLWSYNFVSPGCNINAGNLEWLMAYWREVRHSAKKMRLAVHAWGRWDHGFIEHWNRLLAWMRSRDERSVYITEAGAGANVSYDQAVDWLRGTERIILSTPEVKGVALTAADDVWDGRRWCGLLDANGELTPLGREWRATRGRMRLGNGNDE